MTVIGIDLGTISSSVAIFRDDHPEIIANERGNIITPSIVAFTNEGILVGDSAKEQLKQNPSNTIYNFKRFLGRKFDEPGVQKDISKYPFKILSDDKNMIQFEVQLRGETKLFYPEEITAILLSKLKTDAENYLNEKVTGAVLSVPACFNVRQRQATINAAKIANLKVLSLINETIANSLSIYLSQKADGQRQWIVVDIGGGTFDVSLIFTDRDIFETITIAGNSHFGGENFNDELFQYCVNFLNEKYPELKVESSQQRMLKLRDLCEEAKRTLSTQMLTEIQCDSLFERKGIQIDLSRYLFDDLNAKNYKLISDCIQKVFDDSGNVSVNDITDIYLVGGCSQIPGIRKLIRNFFNGKNLSSIDFNEKQLVASGSSFRAFSFAEEFGSTLLILDSISSSIGTQNPGQIFIPYIPRNTTIPAKKSHAFTTFCEDDQEIEVFMFQGEELKSTDNDMIEKIIVSNIPPAKRNEVLVDFDFIVNENGILDVKIKGHLNNHKIEGLVLTRVKNAFLTNEQVEDRAKNFDSLKKLFLNKSI